MKTKNQKKILITGGLGFIGLKVGLKLSKLHNVTVVDIKKSKKKLKNINVIQGDLSKDNVYNKLDTPFDIIFHFAGQTSSKLSEVNKKNDYINNVVTTEKIANYAEKIKVKKIIFSSSMTVYGKYAENVDEENVVRPQSNYAKNKLKSEKILLKLKKKNIDIVITRLFNVYGPGQDFFNMNQGMISIYLAQAIKNKFIKVTGSLKRYRDFIYIDDLVNAFVLLIKFNSTEIFNIGSGKKTTVLEILRIILKKLKLKKNSYKEINSQKKDVFGSSADIRKINRLTKWYPKIKLDEGVQRTIKDAKLTII